VFLAACRPAPFAPTSPWNTPLGAVGWRDEPALRSAHWWVNLESGSIPAVYAADTDPWVAVSVPSSWGWPGGQVGIHLPDGVGAAAGSDASIVVVSSGTAYNFWQFRRTGPGQATASAWAAARMDGTGFGSGTPFQGAGIRASGASGLGGLITGDDLTSGRIGHALAVSLRGDELRNGFVAPAIAQDGGGGYSGSIPMGSRIGIPAGTPMPAGLSPAGVMVWNALVTYGAHVVDRHDGSAPVVLYADPRSVSPAQADSLRATPYGAPSSLDRIMPYVRVVS
jgi:hypothetical protein